MSTFVFILALLLPGDSVIVLEKIPVGTEEECEAFLTEYDEKVVQPNAENFYNIMGQLQAEELIGSCIPEDMADKLGS